MPYAYVLRAGVFLVKLGLVGMLGMLARSSAGRLWLFGAVLQDQGKEGGVETYLLHLHMWDRCKCVCTRTCSYTLPWSELQLIIIYWGKGESCVARTVLSSSRGFAQFGGMLSRNTMLSRRQADRQVWHSITDTWRNIRELTTTHPYVITFMYMYVNMWM